MTTKLRRKKILKVTGIIIGSLFLLLLGFHLWINYNARFIVQDMVETRSHGKLKMKLKKFRFSWFSKKVELEDALIYSTDSVNSVTAYRFHVQHIKLSVQKIWPILFEKKLLIDSLNVLEPEMVVTRIKPRPDSSRSNKDFSIPEELGKIYQSIQEALSALQVNRFQLDNARFTLLNKLHPELQPLRISNIHFHIDNLAVGKKNDPDSKLLFSDNVVLQSHHQDIIFPDGRHRLSFRNFNINLKDQLVAFDSCTILTEQKGNANSRFRVFFDTLRLSHINFDTLYRTEVIAADSVYCKRPQFDLDVETGSGKDKKAGPKLDEIVQQLTGDLLVNHVVVQNAGFHIRTNNTDKDRESSFNFTDNSFELHRLRVDQHDPRPLTVDSVDFAIRNFENFIRDSTYQLRFDSVRIRKDRIYLDHFVFTKREKGQLIHRFLIPRFELTGLSWDDLLFNKQLKARAAHLYQPDIRYNAAEASTGTGGKKSIFSTLAEINSVITLEKMNITKGKVDIALKNNNAVQLEDANISVSTRTLLKAKRDRDFEPAVDYLDFSKGFIRAGNTSIALDNVMYTGAKNRFILASRLQVTGAENELNVQAENAAVNDVLIDEETGDITATGIRWDKAGITLHLPDSAKKQAPDVELEDLLGGETTVRIEKGNRMINAHVRRISFDALQAGKDGPLYITGLKTNADGLSYTAQGETLLADSVELTDLSPSSVFNIRYTHQLPADTFIATAPRVNLSPDINALLNGQVKLRDVQVIRPVITLNQQAVAGGKMLPLDINSIRITEPDIHIKRKDAAQQASLSWAHTSGNFLNLNGLYADPEDPGQLKSGSLELLLNNFSVILPGGKRFNTGDGVVSGQFSELKYTSSPDEPASWSAWVNKLNFRDFKFNNPGKRNGKLQIREAAVADAYLHSDIIADPYKLVAVNNRFRVERFSGDYQDSTQTFYWKNAGFSQLTNQFSADSFVYRPAFSADSFMARQQYQKDYIATGFGSVLIGPIDKEAFLRDSAFHVQQINVDKAWFTDLRDQRLPFAAGTIRPLPVKLLQKIPFRFTADSVDVQPSSVDYTEISNKTKLSGTVPIRRLTLHLKNVKNYALQPGDSLSIHASGYIMDSIWVRLRVKQSYTDSLGGFKMTMQAKAGDITILNPVLIPLASAKIVSGDIDTIFLSAVGREYLAIGKMQMYYRGLKFRYLKNAKDGKQPFMTRLLNAAANTFVLRRNNKSRTGDVFFIRKRDRSAINYLLRIALSGMSNSAGIKNYRKQMRKYRDEMEKKGLPPVDYE